MPRKSKTLLETMLDLVEGVTAAELGTFVLLAERELKKRKILPARPGRKPSPKPVPVATE